LKNSIRTINTFSVLARGDFGVLWKLPDRGSSPRANRPIRFWCLIFGVCLIGQPIYSGFVLNNVVSSVRHFAFHRLRPWVPPVLFLVSYLISVLFVSKSTKAAAVAWSPDRQLTLVIRGKFFLTLNLVPVRLIVIKAFKGHLAFCFFIVLKRNQVWSPIFQLIGLF